MTPKVFVSAVGMLIALIGLGIGIWGVTVQDPTSMSSTSSTYTRDCGSAFSPKGFVPSGTDFSGRGQHWNAMQDCDDALDGRRTWALVLIGVGLVAFAGGVVVKSGGAPVRPAEQPAPSDPPTA